MNPPKVINDPYFWMRDDEREDEAVINHLKAENAYTGAMTAPLKALKTKLYDELLSHIKETDVKVPYRYGDYFYYTRTVQGHSYKIHCRKRSLDADAVEEVILDENAEAEGKAHFDVGDVQPSPDHTLLAYTVDLVGNEKYGVVVKELSTGRFLPCSITNSDGGVEWGRDNSTLFYTLLDDALRPYKVYRHRLVDGDSSGGGEEESKADELLVEEPDERFRLGVMKSNSGRFIVIGCSSIVTSETHVVDLEEAGAGGGGGTPLLVAARRDKVLYRVYHQGDRFFVLTNQDGATNFKLMTTHKDVASAEHWVEVVGHSPTRHLKFLVVFREHVVVYGREGGLSQLWTLTDNAAHDAEVHHGRHVAREAPRLTQLEMEEDVCTVYPTSNYHYDSHTLRFAYTSFISPQATYDYDMRSGKRTLLKETEVPHYDRSLYQAGKTVAVAEDGTEVPITYVFRKGHDPGITGARSSAPSPLLLYGYGSYGVSIDPEFTSTRLPLLDRGVCFAVAHVRGGGEMGRAWYQEQGKFLTKKNTFSDFVSCARHLIDIGATAPDRLAITGRSAGGLLMGGVLNQAPELFRVAVAGVPFVDLMVTMCDASIPLTVPEWEEWGNPNQERYFQYMMDYSPIDNIAPRPLPAILVTAGLHDPRVAYWEPAKWVAKLRENNTGKHAVLFKVDLTSGHFSASDRYKFLDERAFEYAYLLNELDCTRLIEASSCEE